MSKYVKDLMSRELQRRLEGVQDALLVNVVGMDAIVTSTMRKTLREKNIHLTVVKNSLARRATEGTPLAAAFSGVEGTTALVWGGEDIVSLAKAVTQLAEDKKFAPFQTRGGVLDGKQLTPSDVKQVSKWPTRQEQLSIIAGQILGPGARLAAQLLGPGGALASQIKQLAEKNDEAQTTNDESVAN